MAFDPDKFLEETSVAEFDPDAFLAETAISSQPPGSELTSEDTSPEARTMVQESIQQDALRKQQQQRHTRYSTIDPDWRNLKSPQTNKQIGYEDLVGLMGGAAPSLEPEGYLAAREIWDAPNAAAAMRVMGML